jgi:hypothetical protein
VHSVRINSGGFVDVIWWILGDNRGAVLEFGTEFRKADGMECAVFFTRHYRAQVLSKRESTEDKRKH